MNGDNHERYTDDPARQQYRGNRLIRVPDDFRAHAVFRKVTGLIAVIEEQAPNNRNDILAALENHGFETMEFILRPTLP